MVERRPGIARSESIACPPVGLGMGCAPSLSERARSGSWKSQAVWYDALRWDLPEAHTEPKMPAVAAMMVDVGKLDMVPEVVDHYTEPIDLILSCLSVQGLGGSGLQVSASVFA